MRIIKIIRFILEVLIVIDFIILSFPIAIMIFFLVIIKMIYPPFIG